MSRTGSVTNLPLMHCVPDNVPEAARHLLRLQSALSDSVMAATAAAERLTERTQPSTPRAKPAAV